MNQWPTDPAASTNLLHLLVKNIDRGGLLLGDRLLDVLLGTAWPTEVAQSQ